MIPSEWEDFMRRISIVVSGCIVIKRLNSNRKALSVRARGFVHLPMIDQFRGDMEATANLSFLHSLARANLSTASLVRTLGRITGCRCCPLLKFSTSIGRVLDQLLCRTKTPGSEKGERYHQTQDRKDH